jgi:hypothetical protein
VLELAEEALDEVALAVDIAIDNASDADVGLAGDMGFCALGLDPLDDGTSKEAAVGTSWAKGKPSMSVGNVVLSEA